MNPLDTQDVVRLMLIFVRISALTVSTPVFSNPAVPKKIRILFSAVFAWLLVFVLPETYFPYADSPLGLTLLVFREALVGITLGFTVYMIFLTAQFAGELIGFQVGLRMAQAFDPASGTNTDPMGRILLLIVTLTFLVLDGHLYLFQALYASFEVIPLGGGTAAAAGPFMIDLAAGMFVTSIRIASPFMATIFMVDLTLGIFARLVPQADFFAIGLPIKLASGMLMIWAFLNTFFELMPATFLGMYDDLMKVIEVIQ